MLLLLFFSKAKQIANVAVANLFFSKAKQIANVAVAIFFSKAK